MTSSKGTMGKILGLLRRFSGTFYRKLSRRKVKSSRELTRFLPRS